jgi:hypothetical protein
MLRLLHGVLVRYHGYVTPAAERRRSSRFFTEGSRRERLPPAPFGAEGWQSVSLDLLVWPITELIEAGSLQGRGDVNRIGLPSEVRHPAIAGPPAARFG